MPKDRHPAAMPRSGPVLAAAPWPRLPVLKTRRDAGCTASSLRGAVAATDPFIAVDLFRMSQPSFAPHPHAGFSAVTYLFDSAEGGLVSRDSLGGRWPIRPGDLHWTLAGSGVMHEEAPQQPGRTAHGLQIFVNLPAAQKQRPPAVLRLAREQMPERHGPGWREVQVFGGHAPLLLPVAAALRVVHLQAGARFVFDVACDEQGFLWATSGHAANLAEGEAVPLTGPLQLRAESPMVLACFSGRPLRENVVQHGPFVMNTEAELVAAMQRFQCGQMGRLGGIAPGL